MDPLKGFVGFLKSGWGILSSITVFFPFADQLTKIVLVPAINADEDFQLATINSIICAFVLLFCFSLQYRKKSLGFALLMFIVGIAAFVSYGNFVSPIQDLKSIGINADITYLSSYPIEVYKGLYLAIFGSLTGAFTSLMAYIYRPSSGYGLPGW